MFFSPEITDQIAENVLHVNNGKSKCSITVEHLDYDQLLQPVDKRFTTIHENNKQWSYVPIPFTQRVNDRFAAPESMPAPLSTRVATHFLEQLTRLIKKSKQFNQSDIASDIAALTLTLCVNRPLEQR